MKPLLTCLALLFGLSAGAVAAQAARFPASVEAALSEFETCVANAATLTTPAMVPDVAVRARVFAALIGGCEELRAQALTQIALKDQQASIDAEIQAITARLIADAKAQNGL